MVLRHLLYFDSLLTAVLKRVYCNLKKKESMIGGSYLILSYRQPIDLIEILISQ